MLFEEYTLKPEVILTLAATESDTTAGQTFAGLWATHTDDSDAEMGVAPPVPIEDEMTLLDISSNNDGSSISDEVDMEPLIPAASCFDISTIPHDVLTEIFQRCVLDSAHISKGGALSMPMVLSQVSHRWRDVALNLPPLWNTVTIDFSAGWRHIPQLIASAHDHLRRSGARPISIHTIGAPGRKEPSSDHKNCIASLVGPWISRIEHLTLSFPSEWMNIFLAQPIDIVGFPVLRSAKLVYHPLQSVRRVGGMDALAHAPRLRSVDITYMSETTGGVTDGEFHLPWGQLHELHLRNLAVHPVYLPPILDACPALHTCTLTVSSRANDALNHTTLAFHPFIAGAIETTVVPGIRKLTLHHPVAKLTYDKDLAKVLFPSLESLAITTTPANLPPPPSASRVPSKIPRKSCISTQLHIQWSHSQLLSFLSRNLPSTSGLRSLSTNLPLLPGAIEYLLGDLPSLHALSVMQSAPLSSTTIRLLAQRHVGPELERVRCVVKPEVVEEFFDMLDCRVPTTVGRGWGGRVRGGIREVVVVTKLGGMGRSEREEVRERMGECRRMGRKVRVVEGVEEGDGEGEW